jgi:hypothetical protein
MAPYFILGMVLLFVVVLVARWAADADPRKLAVAVKIGGGVLAVALVALLLFSGRLPTVMYFLPFALPFFLQWRARHIRRRNAQGPRPGATSEVDTGWLRMELDHDSGAMRGTVQRGAFAGRGLAGMSLDELLALRDELAADPDSLRVLDAYLDRVHGGRADDGAGTAEPGAGSGGGSGGSPGGAMSEAEALEILGLEPGADADAIKQAHHRLMARMHPDRGGSTYLAAKLNQARDILLKGH